MPGVRDRNLRSGDLHEEFGLFLLRMVGLVAPVPRQEDVGNDAFVTLVRPEGSRRLLPDVSFLVQLKAASVGEVCYSQPNEVDWITNLEIPLFFGRVDLKRSRIELFSTFRLHQILIEHKYQEICLLFDAGDESTTWPAARRANLGPPVHAWSLEDASQPDFQMRSFEILRPHIENLRVNLGLREIRYMQWLRWETGSPPKESGVMMMGLHDDDKRKMLQKMVPAIHRMLLEVMHKKRFGDFRVLYEMVQLMRRWGFDPDPHGDMLRMTALQAEGPEISDKEVIMLRYSAGDNCLNANRQRIVQSGWFSFRHRITALNVCGNRQRPRG